MTPTDLQAIRERWGKVIKGEYVVKKSYNTEIYLGPVKKCEFGFSHKGKILEMEDAECSDFSKTQINNTARAIASAPTDIADLLAEVERLQWENAELKSIEAGAGFLNDGQQTEIERLNASLAHACRLLAQTDQCPIKKCDLDRKRCAAAACWRGEAEGLK